MRRCRIPDHVQHLPAQAGRIRRKGSGPGIHPGPTAGAQPAVPQSAVRDHACPPTGRPCRGAVIVSAVAYAAQPGSERSKLPAAAILPLRRRHPAGVRRPQGRSRANRTTADRLPARRSRTGTVIGENVDHPCPHPTGAVPRLRDFRRIQQSQDTQTLHDRSAEAPLDGVEDGGSLQGHDHDTARATHATKPASNAQAGNHWSRISAGCRSNGTRPRSSPTASRPGRSTRTRSSSHGSSTGDANSADARAISTFTTSARWPISPKPVTPNLFGHRSESGIRDFGDLRVGDPLPGVRIADRARVSHRSPRVLADRPLPLHGMVLGQHQRNWTPRGGTHQQPSECHRPNRHAPGSRSREISADRCRQRRSPFRRMRYPRFRCVRRKRPAWHTRRPGAAASRYRRTPAPLAPGSSSTRWHSWARCPRSTASSWRA